MKRSFYLTPCVAAALFLSVPCEAALVAHWTGDDTAIDATANGHDGTLAGNAGYTAGQVGNAFSFDGVRGSIVTVDADADLEPATISISLWVKSELENHLRLLADSTHGVGSAGWAIQLNSANNVSFAYGNGSSFPEVVGQIGLGDGEFHHVAATLDGTTMRLYTNGELESTLAYTGTPMPSGRDIQLGDSLPLNRPLDGALDEVRIYNHVLSESEITQLASVPEPATLGLLGLAGLGLLGGRRRG